MRTSLQQQIRRAALALALTCAASAQAAFTITTFTYPGSVATRGWQINDMLQVATTAELASGTPAFAGAVYQFSSGTFTTLPPFAPGVVASPVGINNAAVTTGAAPDEVTGEGPGFLFGAAYSTFNYPGAVFTSGRGVNLAGKVAGYWQAADDSIGGFIYDSIAHTYTDIVIPGAQFMIPHGINAAGTVSGSVILSPGSAFAGSPGGQYGFIRAASGALTLYRVNGLPTRSRGINDSGRVAGWLTDAPGSSKGFVINAPSGGGYVNVAVAAADYIGVAGATFTFAEGINNAGYVSGSADMAVGGSVGYVAAPPAVAQIADLSTQIGGFGLPFGTENALQAKLRAAQAAIAAGDISGACGSLQALINQANAQAGKKLTRAQADAIIAAANVIRASLGCV